MMKKVVLFFFALIMAVGLKAQDLDMFQANLSWKYHGMQKPNILGNGWQISPEFRYYPLGLSYGLAFVPLKSSLCYENELLIGAYFSPTWGSEWKRDNSFEQPGIVQGLPENTSAQKFNFGLSFKYLVNPALFLTLDAGMGIKSLEIKSGVNDSSSRCPYYKSLPIKFELIYFSDLFGNGSTIGVGFLNRIKLSAEIENSFHEYRAFKSGGEYFVDTLAVNPEKLFNISLECTLLSPAIGNTVIDCSVINRYSQVRGGGDLFGFPSGVSGCYEFGFGIALRKIERLDETIKTEIAFSRCGLNIRIIGKLSSLYKPF